MRGWWAVANKKTVGGWAKLNVTLGALASGVVLVIFLTGFNSVPEMLGAVRPSERPGWLLSRALGTFTGYTTNLDFLTDGNRVFPLSQPLMLGENDNFKADHVLLDPYYRESENDLREMSRAFIFALDCRPDRRCRSLKIADTHIVSGRAAFEADRIFLTGLSSFEVTHPELGESDTVSVLMMLFDLRTRQHMEGGFALQGCGERHLYSEGGASNVRLREDRSFEFHINTMCQRAVAQSFGMEFEQRAGTRFEYEVSGRFNDYNELEDLAIARTATPPVLVEAP